MATSATSANKVELLKRLYPGKVHEPFYKASKLASMCAKDTKFGGEGRYVNVTVSPTAGGSASFSDALASQKNSQDIRFFVTHKKEYQVFSIQNEAIARSQGDKNAIVELLKHEVGKARYAFSRAMAKRMWGNAGGSLCRLDSGVTLTSTKLSPREPTDITGFEPNMQLEFASDDGSAASPAGRRGAPDRLTASSVFRGRSDRYVTTSANLNTVSGITVNDYVFRRGDYANAMTGMRGWSPISDPSAAESFFGVDRTDYDLQRASGIRVNGSGADKEDTLQIAMAECQLAGGEVGDSVVCFVNPLDYADLLKSLGAKRERNDKSDGDIGFTYVEVYGAVGSCKCVAEVDVPKGYAWMQSPSKITLRTAGECPMMLAKGYPNQMLTASDDDAKQGRIGAYGNIFNESPGDTVIITW